MLRIAPGGDMAPRVRTLFFCYFSIRAPCGDRSMAKLQFPKNPSPGVTTRNAKRSNPTHPPKSEASVFKSVDLETARVCQKFDGDVSRSFAPIRGDCCWSY